MKRFTLVILLISGVVAEAWSQSHPFIFSGGFSYSKFSYQPDFNDIVGVKQHPILSFDLSVNTEFPLFSHFLLRTGVGYLKSGFRLNYSKRTWSGFPPNGPIGQVYIPEKTGLSRYAFHFLQINTMVKYKPVDRLSIYVVAGPQLNYVLHASSQYTSYSDGKKIGPEQKESLDSAINRYNLFLEGGVGYEFRFFRNLKPYLEVIYVSSLTNLAKSNNGLQFYPYNSQNTWRQRTLILKAGIVI